MADSRADDVAREGADLVAAAAAAESRGGGVDAVESAGGDADRGGAEQLPMQMETGGQQDVPQGRGGGGAADGSTDVSGASVDAPAKSKGMQQPLRKKKRQEFLYLTDVQARAQQTAGRRPDTEQQPEDPRKGPEAEGAEQVPQVPAQEIRREPQPGMERAAETAGARAMTTVTVTLKRARAYNSEDSLNVESEPGEGDWEDKSEWEDGPSHTQTPRPTPLDLPSVPGRPDLDERYRSDPEWRRWYQQMRTKKAELESALNQLTDQLRAPSTPESSIAEGVAVVGGGEQQPHQQQQRQQRQQQRQTSDPDVSSPVPLSREDEGERPTVLQAPTVLIEWPEEGGDGSSTVLQVPWIQTLEELQQLGNVRRLEILGEVEPVGAGTGSEEAGPDSDWIPSSQQTLSQQQQSGTQQQQRQSAVRPEAEAEAVAGVRRPETVAEVEEEELPADWSTVLCNLTGDQLRSADLVVLWHHMVSALQIQDVPPDERTNISGYSQQQTLDYLDRHHGPMLDALRSVQLKETPRLRDRRARVMDLAEKAALFKTFRRHRTPLEWPTWLRDEGMMQLLADLLRFWRGQKATREQMRQKEGEAALPPLRVPVATAEGRAIGLERWIRWLQDAFHAMEERLRLRRSWEARGAADQSATASQSSVGGADGRGDIGGGRRGRSSSIPPRVEVSLVERVAARDRSSSGGSADRRSCHSLTRRLSPVVRITRDPVTEGHGQRQQQQRQQRQERQSRDARQQQQHEPRRREKTGPQRPPEAGESQMARWQAAQEAAKRDAERARAAPVATAVPAQEKEVIDLASDSAPSDGVVPETPERPVAAAEEEMITEGPTFFAEQDVESRRQPSIESTSSPPRSASQRPQGQQPSENNGGDPTLQEKEGIAAPPREQRKQRPRQQQQRRSGATEGRGGAAGEDATARRRERSRSPRDERSRRSPEQARTVLEPRQEADAAGMSSSPGPNASPDSSRAAPTHTSTQRPPPPSGQTPSDIEMAEMYIPSPGERREDRERVQETQRETLLNKEGSAVPAAEAIGATSKTVVPRDKNQPAGGRPQKNKSQTGQQAAVATQSIAAAATAEPQAAAASTNTDTNTSNTHAPTPTRTYASAARGDPRPRGIRGLTAQEMAGARAAAVAAEATAAAGDPAGISQAARVGSIGAGSGRPLTAHERQVLQAELDVMENDAFLQAFYNEGGRNADRWQRFVIRLRHRGRDPGSFTREWVTSLLEEGLGLRPVDVPAIASPLGLREIDLEFDTEREYMRFWEVCSAKVRENPRLLDEVVLVPLFRGETKVLNVSFRTTKIPPRDIDGWLRRHCRVLQETQQRVDEKGYRMAEYRTIIQLERNERGGYRHVPKYFFLGADRGTTRYAGQPPACYVCGAWDHFRVGCTAELCSRCGVRGHRTVACPRQVTCNLCGTEGHEYRMCPEAYLNVMYPEEFAEEVRRVQQEQDKRREEREARLRRQKEQQEKWQQQRKKQRPGKPTRQQQQEPREAREVGRKSKGGAPPPPSTGSDPQWAFEDEANLSEVSEGEGGHPRQREPHTESEEEEEERAGSDSKEEEEEEEEENEEEDDEEDMEVGGGDGGEKTEKGARKRGEGETEGRPKKKQKLNSRQRRNKRRQAEREAKRREVAAAAAVHRDVQDQRDKDKGVEGREVERGEEAQEEATAGRFVETIVVTLDARQAKRARQPARPQKEADRRREAEKRDIEKKLEYMERLREEHRKEEKRLHAHLRGFTKEATFQDFEKVMKDIDEHQEAVRALGMEIRRLKELKGSLRRREGRPEVVEAEDRQQQEQPASGEGHTSSLVYPPSPGDREAGEEAEDIEPRPPEQPTTHARKPSKEQQRPSSAATVATCTRPPDEVREPSPEATDQSGKTAESVAASPSQIPLHQPEVTEKSPPKSPQTPTHTPIRPSPTSTPLPSTPTHISNPSTALGTPQQQVGIVRPVASSTPVPSPQTANLQQVLSPPVLFSTVHVLRQQPESPFSRTVTWEVSPSPAEDEPGRCPVGATPGTQSELEQESEPRGSISISGSFSEESG